jgi:hypothetical protein
MERRRGRYLGTEIEGKWWKRYLHEGFFAQGSGEYWCDQRAFYFLRYLTRDPLTIPFHQVTGLTAGTWHAGQWACGSLIIKLLWVNQGRRLSSGFVLSYRKSEALGLVEEMEKQISCSAAGSGA